MKYLVKETFKDKSYLIKEFSSKDIFLKALLEDNPLMFILEIYDEEKLIFGCDWNMKKNGNPKHNIQYDEVYYIFEKKFKEILKCI